MNKVCLKCKLEKPVENFYRASRNSDRFQSYCKPCGIQNGRDWRNKSSFRERDRKRKLLKRHGVTLEQYTSMLNTQCGVCRICSLPPTSKRNHEKYNLCVDHCHKTGKIRGLLCKSCNLAIGNMSDNLEWANNIVKYLKETS